MIVKLPVNAISQFKGKYFGSWYNTFSKLNKKVKNPHTLQQFKGVKFG